MPEFKEKIAKLKTRLQQLIKVVKLSEKQKEIIKLERLTQTPDFWQDQLQAQEVMRKLKNLQTETQQLNNLKDRLETASQRTQAGGAKELAELTKELDSLEVKKYLAGPYDNQGAIVTIHAGQGGVEAMDWTAMLKRMYLRFSEKKDWQVTVVDERLGEEAGIKSVTMTIDGLNAYGYLKNEKGTHRLVRQSPFNADNLRQTSFALVGVLPIIEETDEMEIKDDDLKIEFFRSSGAGGQNVNKVSTAVRLKHKPSGLVVESQAQRYQEQNRKTAIKLLKAKLWEIEEEKRQKEIESIKGKHKAASWGNQIRSYVLHPYKQVKDLRTNLVESDPQAVLDGKIDALIEAGLKLGK